MDVQEQGRPRMGSAQWWSSLSGLMTAVGTLVAVLTLVFTVYVWLKPQPDPQLPGGDQGAGPTSAAPPAMLQTPQLGFEFWQNPNRPDISFLGGDPNADRVVVTLARSPFEMRFNKVYAKPGVRICAWTDDSVFNLSQGAAIRDYPCFADGSAMADSNFGSGQLILNNEGFNYFAGNRVQSYSGSQDKIYVSSTYALNEVTTQIADQSSDLYLAVFVDLDGDKVFDFGEYEYLILKF